MNTLKIKTINIDNFKGISSLHKDVEGNVIYVSGKNGAGKTSVLEAIYAAISKAHLPEKPIKEGEDRATINLVLAGKEVELEITRTITQKSNTLVVKENGEKVKNARQLLDGLLSNISVDPFKFMELSEKEQVELMTKACGIDFDFDSFEEEMGNAVTDRKFIKRQIKDLEGSVNSIEVPENMAECNYDIVELNQKLAEATANNVAVRDNIARRERAKERMVQIKKEYEEMKAIYSEEFSEEMVDTRDIEDKIKLASENAAIASKLSLRKEYSEKLESAQLNLKAKEKSIKALEKKKADAMSSFKSPVEGLGTDGKKLYLGEAPYSQASSAERIEVAAKLSMLASKDVKVINIKDASLLDDDMVAKVTDVAKEYDCQVFLEMVNNDQDISLTFEESVASKEVELPDSDIADLATDMDDQEEFIEEMSNGGGEVPQLMEDDIAHYEETGESPMDSLSDEVENDLDDDFFGELEDLK